MIIQPTRRGFLIGLVSLLAAPAIVRIDNIMPVKVIRPDVTYHWTIDGSLFMRLHGIVDSWEKVDPHEVFKDRWNAPGRPRFDSGLLLRRPIE